MKIESRIFAGAIPWLEPHLIPDANASYSQNAKLVSGALEPFLATITVYDPTKVGNLISMYRFAPVAGNDASGYPFTWTNDVDVIRGPIKGDTSERTYYTGDGVPKVTDNALALSGGTDYPMNWYTLGIPAPSASIVATVVGDPDPESTEADATDVAYVITFNSSMGEEGPPSAVSNTVSVRPGQTVTISDLGGPPAGNYNIIAKYIYRTSTGSADTQFYYRDAIAVSTTSYDDSDPIASLAEPLQSTNWLAPPADMHSLGLMDNGICYGASGNLLYLSEPYLPHAWNPLNTQTTGFPIVAVGHFENTIVALTAQNPLLVTGRDPSAMDPIELKNNQGCLSKRSRVNAPYGVLYAAPDGLCLVGPNDPGTIVTERFLTRKQWQALKPSSIQGWLYDGKYFGTYNTGSVQGSFLLDPRDPDNGWQWLDVVPLAGYADALSDCLYLNVGNLIVRWDSNTTYLTMTWTSKQFTFSREQSFTCASIQAASYTALTFRFYVDEVLRHTQTVTSNAIFRMPFVKGRRFRYQIQGSNKVTEVRIASTPQELMVL